MTAEVLAVAALDTAAGALADLAALEVAALEAVALDLAEEA